MGSYEPIPWENFGIAIQFDMDEVYTATAANSRLHVFPDHGPRYAYGELDGPEGPLFFLPKPEEWSAMTAFGFPRIEHDEPDRVAMELGRKILQIQAVETFRVELDHLLD